MAMAVGFGREAFTPVAWRSALHARAVFPYFATSRAIGFIDSHSVRQYTARQISCSACPLFVEGTRITAKQHWHKIVTRGGRSILYEDAESYVLMEPGEEEQFVTQQELQVRLKSWLVKWPVNQLPEDLSQFESLDEVVNHLVHSACELDLGGGLGSIQWFQVERAQLHSPGEEIYTGALILQTCNSVWEQGALIQMQQSQAIRIQCEERCIVLFHRWESVGQSMYENGRDINFEFANIYTSLKYLIYQQMVARTFIPCHW